MNPERKINIFEEDKQKEIKDYIDRKIEAEFSIIDRKLKNSFQAIKQDLYSLKYASGLGIGGRNREIQDVFDEKLVNLKKELEEKVEQLKKIEIQTSSSSRQKKDKVLKKSANKKVLKKTNQNKKKKISKNQKSSKPAKELSRVYEMMQKQLESRMDDLKNKEALLSKQEKQLNKVK